MTFKNKTKQNNNDNNKKQSLANILPEMEINGVIHKERSRSNVCKAFQSQELRKQTVRSSKNDDTTLLSIIF